MNVLDHPLNDYHFRLRYHSLLEHEMQEWYLRTHDKGSIPTEAIVHLLEWRAGFEYYRWEDELGSPLTMRKLLELRYPTNEIPIEAPNQHHSFVLQGVEFSNGLPGSIDARLDGMISPCWVRLVNSILTIDFIGASGDRADGGPAYRRLLRSEKREGTWTNPIIILEWKTNFPVNKEAGVFSATPNTFAAVTAANSITTSVDSDIRDRDEGHDVILSHLDPVWGAGDELFPLAEVDKTLYYIAKSDSVSWGLGRLYSDGRTEGIIHESTPVIGGGAVGPYVVLVRGFDEGGSQIEWYHHPDFSTPIYSSHIGARHVTPYWNIEEKTWYLYGRRPQGNDVLSWKLEEVPSNPNPADEINTNDIIWLATNISDWEQNSTVTDTHVEGPSVCVYHTMAGRWPTFPSDPGPNGEIKTLEGNIWVFGKIDGQWYGGTFEWLRSGQQCKEEAYNMGVLTRRNPLLSWKPESGEQFGLAMSTRARDAKRSGDMRTNIVLTMWP